MLNARTNSGNGDRNYTLSKIPHFEQLEPRILLSADSLINVMAQVQGYPADSGKCLYYLPHQRTGQQGGDVAVSPETLQSAGLASGLQHDHAGPA